MITIIDYYISIDGGGSKTEVCILNVKNETLELLYFGGININQLGEAIFTTRICEIFDSLPLTKNYYICIGVPGYGEASETDKKIQSIMSKLLKEKNYIMVNDVVLAHYASFGLKDGILLLSGTGSMAMSYNQGMMQRAGGWGHLIGDEGSAFSIGLKAINHISHVLDGICAPSPLSELICNTYKFDFSSKLISFVYESTNYRKEIALIAMLVDQAANQGCPVALRILECESKKLVKLVNVLKQSNDLKVSYAGSVFNSNILKRSVEKYGDFQFVEPKLKPVFGGILKIDELEGNCKINEEFIKKLYCSKKQLEDL